MTEIEKLKQTIKRLEIENRKLKRAVEIERNGRYKWEAKARGLIK